MTEAARQSFEEQWPALAGRLYAMLARKKMPLAKREDVVQETGLRLFGMWGHVDSTRPPWGLVVTIALNLLRDEARRHPEREVLGAVPDLPESYDVERAGLARLELRRVRSAMTKMSAAHRSVLLTELGIENHIGDRGADAIKMLRLRARRKLHSLLETASASGALLGLRVRRVLGSGDNIPWTRGISAGSNDAAPLAAGLVAALGLIALPIGSGGIDLPSGGDAPTPVERAVDVGSAGIATENAALATSFRHAKLPAYSSTKASAQRGVRKHRNVGTRRPAPYRVPLPVGDAYVEAGAHVVAAGKGARVGDHGDGRVVCLYGFEGAALPTCDGDPPDSSAGAKAGAKAGSVHQEVEAEVS
jgi:hypothetical protein